MVGDLDRPAARPGRQSGRTRRRGSSRCWKNSAAATCPGRGSSRSKTAVRERGVPLEEWLRERPGPAGGQRGQRQQLRDQPAAAVGDRLARVLRGDQPGHRAAAARPGRRLRHAGLRHPRPLPAGRRSARPRFRARRTGRLRPRAWNWPNGTSAGRTLSQLDAPAGVARRLLPDRRRPGRTLAARSAIGPTGISAGSAFVAAHARGFYFGG